MRFHGENVDEALLDIVVQSDNQFFLTNTSDFRNQTLNESLRSPHRNVNKKIFTLFRIDDNLSEIEEERTKKRKRFQFYLVVGVILILVS